MKKRNDCVICNSDLDEKYAGGIWDLAADVCKELNIDIDSENYTNITVQECIYNHIRDYLASCNYCPVCGTKMKYAKLYEI